MSDPLTDIHEGASLSVELRIDAVCRRFEAAWKAGEQPRPDDFLTGWEGAERLVLLRELNLIDMDYRRRAGETPSFKNHPYESTPNSGVETPVEDPLPRLFGRYTLRSLLGKGGMGRVYLAHDPQLDRLVALKMPNPVEGVMGWRDRFLTEARAAATLTHPHVCPVHDVGEVDGQPYLTMAYIEGETLATKLAREGTFAPAAAAELVRAVARAMHEAHRRGIVHRDLKPANLMLDSASRPVVMDFGLAIRSTATDDLRLTLTGVALGTPAYMPPEQAGGDHESVGPSSDVYSLGVVLFEMLTGRPPFTAKSFGKLLAKIERDLPPAPSSLNPDVDPALEAIILTALAKSPADRFASASELADALDKYLEGDRDQLISLYSKPYLIPDATSEYRPGSATATTAVFPKRRRLAGWLAGAAALLMAAVAGAIIYIETDYGQLVVQLPDANAKVEVRVNGQEVTLDASGGKAIRVRAGANHKLEVTGTDFETVADTYDVKRNGVTLARVTLVPKGGVAKVIPPDPKPDDTSKKDPPKPDPVVAGPPKPVEFPKQSTLIEVPGWQILTDATKEEMQKWLDERKRDKHSVMSLDVILVGNRPVYSAVAALDNRVTDWRAALDVSADAILVPKEIKADLRTHHFVSLSGYAMDGMIRTAILLHSPPTEWDARPDTERDQLAGLDADATKSGYGYRVFRPYAGFRGKTLFAVVTEPKVKDGTRAFDLTAPGLDKLAAEERTAGHRLTSVAGYITEGELRFAAVAQPNPEKWEWQTDTNLSAAELQSKAGTHAAKGFRPSSMTAYPWDGSVRYCVVWVKEPPKPVEYPKGPTLIEVPGWQILTNATRDEMQKWLDERKTDKHSVIWLDVMQAGDKPLFCAAAALDNRVKGWQAFLDVPVVPFSEEMAKRTVGSEKCRGVSLSGYIEGTKSYAAVLLHPSIVSSSGVPDVDRGELARFDTLTNKNGYGYRSFRPYPTFGGATVFAVITDKTGDTPGTRQFDLSGEEVQKFIADQHTAGKWLTSLTAYPGDGKLMFAATVEGNASKAEWETSTDLTPTQLRSKAEEFTKKGVHPSCVTVYPWNGEVRYCVVWVKEPPKPVEYPKGPTLIEAPGWQILTDATKEQMQKWLDERKKDKHSVMWLDAIQVQDKPVFSAVAATDDRHANWQAFLDMPAENVGNGEMLKRIGFKTDHPLAASGYSEGGKVKSVSLWRHDDLPWYLDPDATLGGLKIADEQLHLASGLIRGIRPYSVGDGTAMGVFGHKAIGQKGAHLVDADAEQLAEFVKTRQNSGDRITSFTAYLKEGKLLYAIVSSSNPEKIEWKLDQGLTAEQLKSKTADLIKARFQPACVTAYPFDGAVRYCVVWVKDTPKGKDPTKNP